MATIVYRNAKMFVDDTEIDAQLSELTVNYKCEVLDQTTYGADTRMKKGGLYMGDVAGKGYFDPTGVIPLDALLFSHTGLDESSNPNGLPSVFTMFPDGITEGGVSTGMGVAMKGTVESLTLGGAVGVVLPLQFSVQSRGINH